MRTRFRAAVASALLVLMTLVGAPATGSAEQVEPRVVTYDASQAEEFQDSIHGAARVWNANVLNVRLEPASGGQADLVVLADDGWPRAQPTALGEGTVWMGREAVDQGHHIPRIATHEIGHILGLPDDRTGVCADLMSGASAGTECTNDVPNPEERAEVDRLFAGGTTAPVREAAPAAAG